MISRHIYVIAEIGVNHEGNYLRAKKIYDLSKEPSFDLMLIVVAAKFFPIHKHHAGYDQKTC